jgi:hypothetical protein
MHPRHGTAFFGFVPHRQMPMGAVKEGVSEGTNGSYPMFYLYSDAVLKS